jgi:GT2 family glycosyltransferase
MKIFREKNVSICIVNWNTTKLLKNCIKSIEEKTVGLTYEIIIVDNDSQDDSVSMVKREYPGCLLVESKKNLGFARGNNEAVKNASGKYILYLNPDTELITNAIYGMFIFLERNTNFGAVGCKLVTADGQIQFTCARTFPTPFNQFCLLSMLNRLFPQSRALSTVEMNYWDHSDSREIDCLSGACIMARKDVIDSLGGFDENYFMYAEDVDLCYRIRKDAWKIYYLCEESIFHYEGASSKQKADKHFSALMQRASNYYFLIKHFGHIKGMTFKAAVGIGSIIRLIVLSVLTLFLILTGPKKISPDIFGKYLTLFLWSIGLINSHRQKRIITQEN